MNIDFTREELEALIHLYEMGMNELPRDLTLAEDSVANKLYDALNAASRQVSEEK